MTDTWMILACQSGAQVPVVVASDSSIHRVVDGEEGYPFDRPGAPGIGVLAGSHGFGRLELTPESTRALNAVIADVERYLEISLAAIRRANKRFENASPGAERRQAAKALNAEIRRWLEDED